MTRWRIVGSACLATAVVVSPAVLAESEEGLPTVVFVGVPEGGLTADARRATCATVAVPPEELNPFDATNVVARTELTCGDEAYPAVLSAQLKYFGRDPAGPAAAGTPVGEEAIVRDSTPVTAEARESKFTIAHGWYKTVGTSRVIYPYKLDRRREAPTGCAYLSEYEVKCTVTSSAVFVESLAWLQTLIDDPHVGRT